MCVLLIGRPTQEKYKIENAGCVLIHSKKKKRKKKSGPVSKQKRADFV